MTTLLRFCCLSLLLGVAAAAVFVKKQEADSVLRRWRRANSGFLEELKQGNLERECMEEICNYEEAREVFENDDKTRVFWEQYQGRDPCQVNPCKNNGTCLSVDKSYECRCPEGFEGRHCQMVFEDSLGCVYQNGRCQQFCDGSGDRRRCSCAEGYQLGDDGRQCIARVQFPCGQLVPEQNGLNQSAVVHTRIVGASHCPKGECPWQVTARLVPLSPAASALYRCIQNQTGTSQGGASNRDILIHVLTKVLIQLNGESHCGGVLIHQDWVITAAHCLHGNNTQNLTVVAGENNLEVEDSTEQKIPVSMVIPHHSYNLKTGDSDIALLRLNQPVSVNRFVLPICLPTKDFSERELLLVRYHTVSGWGRRTSGGNVKPTLGAPISPVLRRMEVPILQNSQCSQRAQFNFTSNMLCAGYLGGQQESCRGDDGSPLVTQYGSTHFLTGVVGWGRGCAHPGYYGVYTNVAKFLDWVETTTKNWPTLKMQLLLEQTPV